MMRNRQPLLPPQPGASDKLGFSSVVRVRTQQPLATAPVDRNNPLSVGLVEVLLPRMAGVATTIRRQSSVGVSAELSKTLSVEASDRLTGPCTWLAFIDYSAITLGVYYTLVNLGNTTTFPSDMDRRLLTTLDVSSKLGAVISRNTDLVQDLSITARTSGSFVSALTDPGSGTSSGALYENGVLQATLNYGGSARPFVAGRQRAMFLRSGYMMAVWNRVLSLAEIRSLSRNPWQLFVADLERRFYSLPAASSGMLSNATVFNITTNSANPRVTITI